MSQIVLEYLKVILSGPPVAGGVSVILAVTFRGELRKLIGSIARIRLPGGSELSTSQLEKSREALSAELPAAETPTTAVIPTTAVGQIEVGDERVRLLVESERTTARLWEFRYLNFYLARATQITLDWLAARAPMSLREFDAHLMTLVDSAVERQAIFVALQNHHLIQIKDDLLEITAKGREYLTWRQPLPPLPPRPDTPALPPA